MNVKALRSLPVIDKCYTGPAGNGFTCAWPAVPEGAVPFHADGEVSEQNVFGTSS